MERDDGRRLASICPIGTSVRLKSVALAVHPLLTCFDACRSLVQIKSHAQKVLQRQDDGENIFRRLDENQARTEMLIGMFHARGGEAAALFHPAPAGKRYRQVKQKSAGPGHDGTGADFIIAASALCQLAGPGELVAEEKKSEDDEGKKQDTENVNENSEGNEPSQHVTL